MQRPDRSVVEQVFVHIPGRAVTNNYIGGVFILNTDEIKIVRDEV